jgi:hypothetical protein
LYLKACVWCRCLSIREGQNSVQLETGPVEGRVFGGNSVWTGHLPPNAEAVALPYAFDDWREPYCVSDLGFIR